jgi:hypothetical protein
MQHDPSTCPNKWDYFTGADKLSALEDENAKLQRLLADTMLDNIVPKDL